MSEYLNRIVWLFILATGLPAFGQTTSSLVIIVDDLGNNLRLGQRAINLPGAITYGILPSTPQAQQLASSILASNTYKEIIVHMPMESVNQQTVEPKALSSNQTQTVFAENLNIALQQFPLARGLNNHQGSHLTALTDQMDWLMGELQQTELYFIDSKTTGNSVAKSAAAAHGIPYLVRDVFLDHDPSLEAIDKEYHRALTIAKKKGCAVIIAHPSQTTLHYLEQQIPLLAEKNIVIISGSQAIQQQRKAATIRIRDPLLTKIDDASKTDLTVAN